MSDTFEFGDQIAADDCLRFCPELYLTACRCALGFAGDFTRVLLSVELLANGTIKLRLRVVRPSGLRLRLEKQLHQPSFSAAADAGQASKWLAELNEGYRKDVEGRKKIDAFMDAMPDSMKA